MNLYDQFSEDMAVQAAKNREAAQKPLDIDPWESQSNVQQGVSTVSGQQFTNPYGANPGTFAAPVYAQPMTGSVAASAQVTQPYQHLAMSTPPYVAPMPPPPDTRSAMQKALDVLGGIAGSQARLGGATGTGVNVVRAPSGPDAYNTEIPLYSDFARSTIQPAFGAAGQGLGTALGYGLQAGGGGPLLQTIANAPGVNAPHALGQAGRFAGEGLAPVTLGDVALNVATGDLTGFDDVLKAGAGAVRRGALDYADNAARAGLGAVPEGAVRRTVAPAAPLTSARVGNDVIPDATPLFHGSSQGVDALRPGGSAEGFFGRGAYLSTDPAVAARYANGLESAPTNPRVLEGVANGLNLIDSHVPMGDDFFRLKSALAEVSGNPEGIERRLAGLGPESSLDRVAPRVSDLLPDALSRLGYDGARQGTDVFVRDPRGLSLGKTGSRLEWTNGGSPAPRGSNIPRGISPTEGEGIMRTAGAAEKGGKKVPAAAADTARIDNAIESYRQIVAEDQQFIAKNRKVPDSFLRDAEQHKDALAQLEEARAQGGVLTDSQDRLSPKQRAQADAIYARTVGSSPSTAVPEASPAGLTDAASAPPSGGPSSGIAAGGEDGFAANIRLSKYPEEVRAPIAQWAAEHADEVQAARRGVQSDADVAANARALVEDTGGNFDKLAKSWKPGQAWNAEEVTAIRGALTDATREVMDAADAARMGGLAEQTKLAEAIAKQRSIQEVVHGVTAEAGRSLRAFRQQADVALGAGDVRRVQELLNHTVGTSDPAKLADLADAIKALDASNPASVNNFLRSVNKPGFWDKLHYYWMNSILSGPVTQVRNIMGNTSASLYAPLQRLGAAGIEQPLAAIQGRQAQRFWQEAPASVAGMVQGVPEGVRAALTTMRTGVSPRAAGKLDYRVAPIGGKFGAIVGAPTRALGMMDDFFSAINYRSALNADAVRMARMEGLKGDALTTRIASLVADPPPSLMNSATKKADELVFRGDPGDLAKWLGSGRNKVPALRYVMPFVNTPANLLKYGVKNSPLGLLDKGAWAKAIAGNPEGADELAHAFMGSAIAASLATAVATGAMDITAAAPVDPAERDRFYREGKMPFSVRIPGVGWVEYKQFPMLDTTFTLVGSAVDGIRRGEDVSGIASQAGANIATNLLDKSYMSGIGDLFDAVQDPARYAERWATRQVSGFVPFSGATRQTAQAIDQTIRDPEGFKETLQAQTPFLSKDVPPRLTAFGETSDRGFPSPTRVSSDKTTQVDAELERLGEEVSFVGKLKGGSRAEQYAYQQMAGEMHKFLLERVISDPRYESLPDTGKMKVIESLVTNARGPVRDVLDALRSSEGYQSASEADKREMLNRAAEKWIAKIEERR